MVIEFGGYPFEGPYPVAYKLEDKAGVFLILDRRDYVFYVIDVGEASKVRTRIENNYRERQWSKQIKGQIFVAALYTPNEQKPGRIKIKKEIRKQYNPPCRK